MIRILRLDLGLRCWVDDGVFCRVLNVEFGALGFSSFYRDLDYRLRVRIMGPCLGFALSLAGTPRHAAQYESKLKA